MHTSGNVPPTCPLVVRGRAGLAKTALLSLTSPHTLAGNSPEILSRQAGRQGLFKYNKEGVHALTGGGLGNTSA